MADGGSSMDPFWWWRLWFGAFGLAPQQLTQSILPGWSLININETNSSAPETEYRIVAGDSYGRQLGRLLDAVSALIDERGKTAPPRDAFVQLADLKKRIDATKQAAAVGRLQRIRDELALLKKQNAEEYQAQIGAIRALIDG